MENVSRRDLSYYTPASRWQSWKLQLASQTGKVSPSFLDTGNAQARYVFSAQEQTRETGECFK